MLAQTLADVRKRIARAGSKGLNEMNTRATLVEPVLAALGWEVGEVDEVAREFRLKSRDKPVDYALLVLREPRLFVEAKGLGGDLNDRRWANQIMGYAAVAGVEWIVLTDGNEYRIYNSHASVPVEQKMLRSFKLSDCTDEAGEFLGLLTKSELHTNRIGALWKAHFIDRQVRGALERLFSRDDDLVLVNHVQRLTKDLTPEDIRGSMRRCKLALDFPLSPGDLIVAPKVRKGKAAPRRASAGEKVTVLDLIRGGLLPAPTKLSRKYKGRILEARLLPDGSIECVGSTFSSLSQAGSAARATVTGLRPDGQMRATNGWTFWQWRRPQGQLVEVDQLRTEFLARGDRAGATGA